VFKICNAYDASVDEAAIRPFNARSLVLSVLLGLPQPRLATAAPGRLARLFGIAPGTMRTAISRMLAGGELAVVDGSYELRGPLIERKAAQDVGRRPAGDAWDGNWWFVTVITPSRRLADRRLFRTSMANARMGELRPDTWLRPANLAGPTAGSGTIVVRGSLAGEDPGALTARLWDLDAIAARGAELLVAVDGGIGALEDATDAALPDAIVLAAGVVRFLRAEPLLPRPLTPRGWPADRLRQRYAVYDRALGRVLRRALDQPP
jgi:phenylacetic acid degradation operon negative regulatory protein